MNIDALIQFSISIIRLIFIVLLYLAMVVSLGSKTLIKDLINGVIALVEGNMTIGDTVIVSGHTGIIESISLRCLYLRYSSGALHTIPFSEVKDLINLSVGHSVACIAVYITAHDSLETIKKVMQAIYDNLKKDPFFSRYIKSALVFHGITNFTENGALVKGYITIHP